MAAMLTLMAIPSVMGATPVAADDSCTGHREAPSTAQAFCIGIHRNDAGTIDCIGLYFEERMLCFGVPGLGQ